ncbi:MAG: S41 family peptidase, partial [Dehalococcoidia bacterium]
ISRPSEIQPVEVTVVREAIELTSVSARVHGDGIGVIQLESFDARTVENLRQAIAELRQEGMEGLVLDIRYNTGGLVDAAVGVVSEFIESGNAFTIREGDGTETPYEVTGEGSAYDIPMVVLTNGFTASAAEILTGAVQDHDRATVVGTTTFGKGSVSILFQLDSGAGFNVTTARWLTPNGRVIEGEGLAPDIEIASGLEPPAEDEISSLTRSLCETFEDERQTLEDRPDTAAAIEALCSAGPEDTPATGEDVQMEVAVETLRELMQGN